MKIRFVLFICFVVISVTSFGQGVNDNSTSFRTKKKIEVLDTCLKNDSKTYEAFMTIEKDTKFLHLEIVASLENGRCRIEMYDPKGEKWKKDLVFDAGYNAGRIMEITTPDSLPRITVGGYGISLRKPQSGQWRIHLVPDGATGNVKIYYSVSSN